jgi:hypothetical protein
MAVLERGQHSRHDDSPGAQAEGIRSSLRLLAEVGGQRLVRRYGGWSVASGR